MALKYTRVRDLETGHHYDVLSHKVDPEKHEVLDHYRETTIPRPPKPNVKRAATTSNRKKREEDTPTEDGAEGA